MLTLYDPAPPTRFELDHARLARAIGDLMNVAEAPVFWLVLSSGERGFPPFTSPLGDALERFGDPPNAALDLWRVCAGLDLVRRVWTGAPLGVPAYADVATAVRRAREAMEADAGRAAAVAPAEAAAPDLVEPDEAVGVPAGLVADEQPRLAGVA